MNPRAAAELGLAPYDSADYLKTDDDIAGYIEACMAEGGDDPAFVARALGVVARARGMAAVAREAGITREGLYKALAQDGNPSYATVARVARALGLRIRLEPL